MVYYNFVIKRNFNSHVFEIILWKIKSKSSTNIGKSEINCLLTNQTNYYKTWKLFMDKNKKYIQKIILGALSWNKSKQR